QQWVNCRGADLSLSLEQLRDGYSLTAIKEKKVYRYDVTTAKESAANTTPTTIRSGSSTLTRASSVSSTTPWAISSRKSNPWITMPNGTMARAIPTNTMK